MADDIDMYNDIEKMDGRRKETKLLNTCYYYKFMEGDEERAEFFKNKFIKLFGYWGNYY